jgi:hypothetical protein
MNKILFLFIFLILISGCTEEEMAREIMSDVPLVGWITRAAADDAQSLNKIDDKDSDGKNDSWDLKVVVKDAPEKCPKHQYWDYRYGCVCEGDYYLQDGTCVSKSSRQCTVDRDCSPDGVLSKCINEYSKKVYYCDLSSYTCVGGKGVGVTVDCRDDFGRNSRCSNGMCT